MSKGKILELLRPDPNTGKVYTLLTVEVFGVIRALMPFRLTGGSKDYIVVGSDSGRIVILEYIPSKNIFEKVSCIYILSHHDVNLPKIISGVSKDVVILFSNFSVLVKQNYNVAFRYIKKHLVKVAADALYQASTWLLTLKAEQS